MMHTPGSETESGKKGDGYIKGVFSAPDNIIIKHNSYGFYFYFAMECIRNIFIFILYLLN